MKKMFAALSAIALGCGSSSFESTGGDVPAGGSSTSETAPVGGGSGTDAPAEGTSSSSSGSSSGEAAPPPPKVVVTKETVDVWGQARTFVLVVPVSYVATKTYPLIFAFHGDGGDGAGLRAVFPIDGESGAAAIVVYPDGKDATWDLYTPEASNEDNAFVDAIASSLETRFSIDETRVFGSGYSSGAFFVNQVACRRTGFFRGIAPNAGGAPQEPQDPLATYWSGSYTKCANQTGGVAALVMHGSDDYVVGTGSGTYDAKYWATVNGCDATEESRTPTAPSPCVQHAGCPTDKRVLYCEIPGIGHGIWSESAKTTWAFFTGL